MGQKRPRVLTAEVEVDGPGDLAHLVLGLDLVEAGVGLNDVIQLEHHEELVRSYGLDAHKGASVLDKVRFTAVPVDIGLGRGQQLALEHQPVALILLPQLRLLREARREVIGHPHPGWPAGTTAALWLLLLLPQSQANSPPSQIRPPSALSPAHTYQQLHQVKASSFHFMFEFRKNLRTFTGIYANEAHIKCVNLVCIQ